MKTTFKCNKGGRGSHVSLYIVNINLSGSIIGTTFLCVICGTIFCVMWQLYAYSCSESDIYA